MILNFLAFFKANLTLLKYLEIKRRKEYTYVVNMLVYLLCKKYKTKDVNDKLRIPPKSYSMVIIKLCLLLFSIVQVACKDILLWNIYLFIS